MNLGIDTSDIEAARRSYSVFSDRRFNAGLATALSRTAVQVKDAEQREMLDSFDRPTRFTLSAIFAKPATAQSLEAQVWIKDDGAGRSPLTWLRWQVFGGERRIKAFEKLLRSQGALPSGMVTVPGQAARLDAFGNWSTGQLRQVLSQLRIEPTQGATSALPRLTAGDREILKRTGGKAGGLAGPARSALLDARAKNNRIQSAYRRAGGQFVAFPQGRGKLPAGIYRVRSTAWGRTSPQPILIFVDGARYEAGRFDFFYAGQKVADRVLPVEVDRALGEQLQRWAAKTGGRP